MLLGEQSPRLSSVPAGETDRGDEAVAFVRWAGMTLYPWQEDLLRDMCRTTDTGVWSAREVVVSLARQNGKGEVLVARELAGIYLFGERGIFHSAHFMDTAIDAQKRLWEVIEGNDNLFYWWEDDEDTPGVPRMGKTNGKENITFPNGAMVYFRTRTKKTGRGLSIDLLIFDECFDLPRETYSAMSKLIRARERAQAVYISSPVNREEHYHGDIFSAKRWAGVDGADRVLFKEWSPDEDDDPFAQSTWAKCNPSMVDAGAGALLADIESEAVSAQNSSALLDSFMVETLGRGNWVPRDADVGEEFVPIFDIEEWGRRYRPLPDELAGRGLAGVTDTCLAVDATPDGENVSMVIAISSGQDVYLSLHPMTEFDRSQITTTGARYTSVEVHDSVAVVLDDTGALSTLIDQFQELGVSPDVLNGAQVSKAYELFLTMLREGRVFHDGNPRWSEALEIAEERSKNGRYRSLERFVGDVTCLVAASFAVWGLREFGAPIDGPDVKKKMKFVGHARPVKGRRVAAGMAF